MSCRRTPLLTVLALTLAILAGTWPAAQAGEQPLGLAVIGRASQEFTPDQGRLVVGVLNQAPTSAEAARFNAAAMDKVSAAVKARLGAGDQVKSLGYSLYPKSEWDQVARKSRRVGYEASHRLEVLSRDAQALGALLDAAVAAGANMVNGPAWSLSDPAAARRQVQALALADALAQATALAQAAGLQLGPLLALETEETAPLHRGMPQAMESAAPGAPAPATTLEPGVISVQASLRCRWGLGPRP